jgi:hypothetical protein
MEKMKSGHILPINPTLIRVMRVLRIARGKTNYNNIELESSTVRRWARLTIRFAA